MTWSVSTGIFVIIAFSYFKILQASVKQGRGDRSVRSKAFQTCSSHLVMYVLYEIASVIVILSYRFPSMSQNIKKFFSILFIIIPPAINPIIYGLVSKELRASIIKHFTSRLSDKKWEGFYFFKLPCSWSYPQLFNLFVKDYIMLRAFLQPSVPRFTPCNHYIPLFSPCVYSLYLK